MILSSSHDSFIATMDNKTHTYKFRHQHLQHNPLVYTVSSSHFTLLRQVLNVNAGFAMTRKSILRNNRRDRQNKRSDQVDQSLLQPSYGQYSSRPRIIRDTLNQRGETTQSPIPRWSDRDNRDSVRPLTARSKSATIAAIVKTISEQVVDGLLGTASFGARRPAMLLICD